MPCCRRNSVRTVGMPTRSAGSWLRCSNSRCLTLPVAVRMTGRSPDATSTAPTPLPGSGAITPTGHLRSGPSATRSGSTPRWCGGRWRRRSRGARGRPPPARAPGRAERNMDRVPRRTIAAQDGALAVRRACGTGVQRRGALLGDLAAVARRLSYDELPVQLTIGIRARIGQSRYGRLRLAGRPARLPRGSVRGGMRRGLLPRRWAPSDFRKHAGSTVVGGTRVAEQRHLDLDALRVGGRGHPARFALDNRNRSLGASALAVLYGREPSGDNGHGSRSKAIAPGRRISQDRTYGGAIAEAPGTSAGPTDALPIPR